MVHLLLGQFDREEIYGDKYIAITQAYFDAMFEGEWMLKPFSKRVVLGVDKSEVIGEYSIKSPYLGAISPTMLSTGVKTLILLDNMDVVVSGERIGDNCWKYVYELGEEKDIYICVNHSVHPSSMPPYVKFIRENDGQYWEGEYWDFMKMSIPIFHKTRREWAAKHGIPYNQD